MKLRTRRPFAKYIDRGTRVEIRDAEGPGTRGVIGLDPGHDSMQVAVRMRFWENGRMHVLRANGTRHRSAETTIGLANQGPHEAFLTVATERTARAVPAGHSRSLKTQLELSGYSVWTYLGSSKARIAMLDDALNPDAPGGLLTVDPSCVDLLDALWRYSCKVNVKSALGWAPKGSAHWIDALSYAVAYVKMEMYSLRCARSGGPRKKSIPGGSFLNVRG